MDAHSDFRRGWDRALLLLYDGDASFCAEHGFLYKLGSLPGIKRVAHTEWQQLIEDFDLSWKEVTLAILEAYTMRTNGSNVQQKGSSLR